MGRAQLEWPKQSVLSLPPSAELPQGAQIGMTRKGGHLPEAGMATHYLERWAADGWSYDSNYEQTLWDYFGLNRFAPPSEQIHQLEHVAVNALLTAREADQEVSTFRGKWATSYEEIAATDQLFIAV